MYHDCFSNFARRNCAFFSDAVPVHRVVRAAEFKMATGCKSLSSIIYIWRSGSYTFLLYLALTLHEKTRMRRPQLHESAPTIYGINVLIRVHMCNMNCHKPQNKSTADRQAQEQLKYAQLL